MSIPLAYGIVSIFQCVDFSYPRELISERKLGFRRGFVERAAM